MDSHLDTGIGNPSLASPDIVSSNNGNKQSINMEMSELYLISFSAGIVKQNKDAAKLLWDLLV